MSSSNALHDAAAAIASADALLITAGAGMGVDSGLPDFRGNDGFWAAYPPFQELGYGFEELAQPHWFMRDPELAWGFYGHRLGLYRQTRPHDGFSILKTWAAAKSGGGFVFTSNVDGHFQKAGFTQEVVMECHGTIHYLQCAEPCCEELWPVHDLDLAVDESTMRAEPPLPACPRCDGVARPNILMFADSGWLWTRTEAQRERLNCWFQALAGKTVVVIECGAGDAIPTVRRQSESVQSYGATLVRINPREPQGPPGTISIALPALAALSALREKLPT